MKGSAGASDLSEAFRLQVPGQALGSGVAGPTGPGGLLSAVMSLRRGVVAAAGLWRDPVGAPPTISPCVEGCTWNPC